MTENSKRAIWVIGMILIIGIIPIAWYWLVLGNTPTIKPGEIRKWLRSMGNNAILIDVREPKEFSNQHISGSVSWPLDEITTISSLAQIPAEFQDKTLFMICESGFSSVQAVRHLRALGARNIVNVRGGIQEWISAGNLSTGLNIVRYESMEGADVDIYTEMSLFQQIAAVTGGFVIKPLHMILSVLTIWVLLRVRSTDLTALRWGLIFFLSGEAACAINYLVFKHEAYLAEYFHSYWMVVGFAFTFYALMDGMDRRLIKFGVKDKKCALAELCGKCNKSQPVPCSIRRLILVLLLMSLLMAVMPLLVDLKPESYITSILGSSYSYSWPVLYQLFEGRYTEIIAMLLLGAAFLVMFLVRDQPVPDSARVLAAAGLGALGFGIMRFSFKVIFSNSLIWADFWEELTELFFVLAVVAVLLTFRQQLFREKREAGSVNKPAFQFWSWRLKL